MSKKEDSQDETETMRNDRPLLKCVEIFFQWVYEQCEAELQSFCDDYGLKMVKSQDQSSRKECWISGLEDLDPEKAVNFYKVPEEGHSFTALLEKLEVTAGVCKEYQKLLENLNISELTLIDTCGLDHEEAPDKDELSLRYQFILREQYPNVDAVLFICDAQQERSEGSIRPSFTTLFRSVPTCVAYVVITHADDKDIEKCNIVKAVKPESDFNMSQLYRKARSELKEAGISTTLIKLRLKAMWEYSMLYCSKRPEEIDEIGNKPRRCK